MTSPPPSSQKSNRCSGQFTSKSSVRAKAREKRDAYGSATVHWRKLTDLTEIAMKKTTKRVFTDGQAAGPSAPPTGGAAVFVALYGLPSAVFAQQAVSSGAVASELEEITVTAN